MGSDRQRQDLWRCWQCGSSQSQRALGGGSLGDGMEADLDPGLQCAASKISPDLGTAAAITRLSMRPDPGRFDCFDCLVLAARRSAAGREGGSLDSLFQDPEQ